MIGGAADVVAGYLSEHYQEGASLTEALALAVAALGRSTNERGEPDDRVIPVKDLEVAVLDRTRAQPRKFSRIGRAGSRRCSVTAVPTTSNPVEEGAEHPPGTAATDADPDDPKDPTDQVSGDAPPLPGPGPGRPPAGGPTAARRGRVGRQAGLRQRAKPVRSTLDP